ncbi:MAG: TIGR03905 family TSCPD domain-containing protein [Anaerotruncus sp.]|nr:TIGR03905 family TSCPD domain-containing protein [Anaerotruncus sp.]
MHIEYHPKGVCSRKMEIELEDGIITDLRVTGGCDGNLTGICALVKGRPASEVIQQLRGIRCGFKKTSCPDQLAIALEQAIQ